MNPVADIQPLAVDRQGLVGPRIRDEQRNDLLGELVGTVVVGAARDDCRKAKGVMIARTSMSPAAFDAEYGLFGARGVSSVKKTRRAQRSINFVGRDLHVPANVQFPADIQQHLGADDIGLYEGTGVQNAPVDMTLGRKIDYGIDGLPREFVLKEFAVGNVAPDERVPRMVRDVGQVSRDCRRKSACRC